MTAYVLVQTATPGGRIANLLRRVPGIVFAEDVRGPYDALALVRSEADGDSFQAIVDHVRGLPGGDPCARGAARPGDRGIGGHHRGLIDRFGCGRTRASFCRAPQAMRSLFGVAKGLCEREQRLIDR